MPVSAAITFRMTMGSGYVAVIRGMPVTPGLRCERAVKVVKCNERHQQEAHDHGFIDDQ